MKEALELIQRYKEITREISKLYEEAYKAGNRVSFGYVYPPMRTIGKLDVYKGFLVEQDCIIDKLGIYRYEENFGDDGTSEVIDMIELVIKKFIEVIP